MLDDAEFRRWFRSATGALESARGDLERVTIIGLLQGSAGCGVRGESIAPWFGDACLWA